VLVRRLLPLCLVVPGLVIAGAGTATAHESAAKYERTALLAPPSTEAESAVAMEHVANVQYEPLVEGAAQNGSDIEFLKVGEKEYALAGTLRNGLQITDITDPENPAKAAVYVVRLGDLQSGR
jgi:hypothetical protein